MENSRWSEEKSNSFNFWWYRRVLKNLDGSNAHNIKVQRGENRYLLISRTRNRPRPTNRVYPLSTASVDTRSFRDRWIRRKSVTAGHIDSCTFISRHKVRVYECFLQINRPRSETDRFASDSSDDRHRRVKGPVQRDATRPQTVDNRRPLIAGLLGPVSRVNGTRPDVSRSAD